MVMIGDLTKRLLAGVATVAVCAAAVFLMIGRLTAYAQTQEERQPSAPVFGAAPRAPVAQPPVRPRAPFVQEPQGPAPRPRAIKGQVRLDSIDRAFKGATLTISLYRLLGPDQDIPAERVAELRFFKVHKEVPRAQTYVPFTFGDFFPRPQVRYTLQCYLDINANDVRDAGDYWSERRVDVLTPEDPEVLCIEDFALIGETR